MSEEMATSDGASTEESKIIEEPLDASAKDVVDTSSQVTNEPSSHLEADAPPPAEKLEPITTKDELKEGTNETETEHADPKVEVLPALKRRASDAFSEDGDEFIGFDQTLDSDKSHNYIRILERIEAEVQAASENFSAVKTVMVTPSAVVKASKRPRQDTDGSRPSSGLSSRSDEDGTAASDQGGGGRRGWRPALASPLLRAPLERGWKRELVFRATLDSHMRRNADIYYYTPAGKKLRSMREISENISGTGLSMENFSFFKEPLGLDDPEKEIIRDAKIHRRVESPVSAGVGAATVAPPEGKRTPKPKPPKGVSPEPPKLKVKSVGSRLSAPPPGAATPPAKRRPPPDNNNTQTWKKPRQPPATGAPVAAAPPVPAPVAPVAPPVAAVPPQVPPPPLQSRPLVTSPETPGGTGAVSRVVVQPCSMSCGRGAVPSLACAACLCLYHPACVRAVTTLEPFFCQNCRKPSSPPLEPPPLTHKSGVTSAPAPGPVPVPVPVPVPKRVPVPVPVQPTKQNDQRVLLRMKMSGGAQGKRVWAVSQPAGPAAGAAAASSGPASAGTASAGNAASVRSTLPQSLAVINGRRFIVVPRSLLPQHEKPRSRLSNGAGASPPPAPVPAVSPRRRGRPRADQDHFTPFYTLAEERGYNVAVQIFSFLGMRDLAHCAQVCTLWRRVTATPALWRHVRMKNSHVSDWGGLCGALKRRGTKRLDLRKMLLPQNDKLFWEQFAHHIPAVDTLDRIEMCRCPAMAVEAVCQVSGLVSLSALAIRDALLDPAPLGALRNLTELRLKSMAGLSLAGDLRPLRALNSLKHLSLTSIKELGWCAGEVLGELGQLESLELGECSFRAEFAGVVARLRRLRRLRLERGTAQCAAPALLAALSRLPLLTRLELVNVDVKVGFDDALAECKNIQRLLIIPTYVSQSATTNKQVLSGVLRLKDTLTHLMWGVTIELLRVTELFIDQCEQSGESKKKDIGGLGECIPVLKPVPGCKLPDEHHHVAGPPQVEILPLPTLQRLLSAQLPNTKLKLLRIPFHATWRQTLADFQ